MRKGHVLKTNKKAEIPSHCIFFDTETDEVAISDTEKQLVLKMGSACYVRRFKGYTWSKPTWKRFTKAEAFWKFVSDHCKDKVKLFLFAHNFMFDFTVTEGFIHLEKLGFKLEKAIIDDPPVIIHFRRGEQTLCCLDTFNYFKSSVEELGKGIGLTKLTMPDPGASSEAWDEYNTRDTDILRKAMLDFFGFITDNDLGNFQPTIASQAFTAYRHRFMQHRILIHDDEDALILERASYHGGRTECFYLGHAQGPFYQLDVNSQYPYMMKTCEYPRWHVWNQDNPSLAEVRQLLGGYCLTADCDLHLNEPAIATVANNKLVFPIGDFPAVISTPEIEYCLDNNAIKNTRRVCVYEKAPIFTEYVNTLYALRQEYASKANDSFKLMAKYMLNTLYGKFGQSGYVYDTIEKTTDDEVKTWEVWNVEDQKLIKYRQFGGLIQAMKREGESYNSFPAIAAHVTAYARMYLLQLISVAGYDNVYYVDTDSLVVNHAGYTKLRDYIHPTVLGMLKLERTIKQLTIHGPKDYVFDDTVKIKGIRKNAIQIKPSTYSQDRFRKFKGMLQSGNLNALVVTRTTKTLARTYNKGVRTDNGRVIPLRFLPIHPS